MREQVGKIVWEGCKFLPMPLEVDACLLERVPLPVGQDLDMSNMTLSFRKAVHTDAR
jgi:hypothetical protein